MYCTNCGKEIENHLTQCPYCDMPIIKEEKEKEPEDDSTKWKVLRVVSCCLPCVGLVLYAWQMNKKPLLARKIKSSMLLGIGLVWTGIIAAYIIYIVVLIGALIFYS